MVGPTGTSISPIKDYLATLTLATRQTQFDFLVDTWTYTRFEIDPLKPSITVEFINDVGFPIEAKTLYYNGTILDAKNSCLQP
jgi:hypothetical protein